MSVADLYWTAGKISPLVRVGRILLCVSQVLPRDHLLICVGKNCLYILSGC